MNIINKIISYGAVVSFAITLLWFVIFEGDTSMDSLSITAKVLTSINILFFIGVFLLILTGQFRRK
jgi:hypothetical protein